MAIEVESVLVSMVFLFLGGVNLLKPELMVKLRVWTTRVFLRAKLEPSNKTRLVYRIVGAVFVVIGMVSLYNALV